MANFQITPRAKGLFGGKVRLPSSKSQTLRALVFALLAQGTSTIENPLDSPDTEAMIEALRNFGAKVHRKNNTLWIEGTAGKLRTPDRVIDCQNSGLVLRLIGAISSLCEGWTLLSGDDSIRNSRPAGPLLKGLSQLGATAFSTRNNGKAPIVIQGPLQGGKALVEGQDSQPISGLLIASAFAPKPTTLEVIDPGEKPWVDVTLQWLDRLGLSYERNGYESYTLKGQAQIKSFSYKVPGDLSTLAFPLVAALIEQSGLEIENVDLSDAQGDKLLLTFLEHAGAKLSYCREEKTLSLDPSPLLKGGLIDINPYIDALPILATLGCFSKEPIELYNGSIARNKESDRISCICRELKKMGAVIEEKKDGLKVYPSALKGAKLSCYQDHRLAMSLSIAALRAEGRSIIENIECIDKTYRHFKRDFCHLGAQIETL